MIQALLDCVVRYKFMYLCMYVCEICWGDQWNSANWQGEFGEFATENCGVCSP